MRAIITVGLGFGDEGKGSVVDFLCRKFKSSLVIRYNGGLQAAHTVCLPNGKKHTFHQFGSGTLAGAKTYLDKNVIISPYHMKVEALDLVKLGVHNPMFNMMVHPKALVSTVFHMLINKAAEICRTNKHGTCCAGIGATRQYWLKYGADAIIAKDCATDFDVLVDKLHLLKHRLLTDFSSTLPEKMCASHPVCEVLNDINRSDVNKIARKIRSDSCDISLHETPHYIKDDQVVIFEGAQGVLLDQYYGFYPYTTWSTTTTEHALERIDMDSYGGQVQTIGICRAHMSRHGAGPMPTEDTKITWKDENNPHNPWQGHFRYGYLDIPLIDYAIKCNGGVDGIFVTHMDQQLDSVATAYHYPDYNLLDPVPNPQYQATITKQLGMVQPYYEETNALTQLSKLRRVVGTSKGKTHEDKHLHATLFS